MGALSWLQCFLGLTITVGASFLIATAIDGATRWITKRLVQGLAMWGLLFAATPFINGRPDSLQAQAFALLVAAVMVLYSSELRGILSGECWWAPNAARADSICHALYVSATSRVRWPQLINPVWLLFGNTADGVWGSSAWRAGRDPSVWLAVVWWFRHPAYNLRHHVLGVSGIERVIEGPFGKATYRPGGGLLWCITHVVLLGRWVELPFASVVVGALKAHAGWRPDGGFSIGITLA